jgi:hypothetical protein
MASLNDLTVSLLDRLAKECGIKLKKNTKKTEKITIIENACIEETYLEQLLNKYLAQKSIPRKTSKNAISELKGRVKLLEEQVRFLMSEISVSKVFYKDDRDIITVTTDLADIKKFIKSIISPGETITIDDLIELKEIQKIPLIALKHSIYDLIEEGIFEGVSGNSRQKIGGKIGVLLRK